MLFWEFYRNIKFYCKKGCFNANLWYNYVNNILLLFFDCLRVYGYMYYGGILMERVLNLVDFGEISKDSMLTEINTTTNNEFTVGKDGVNAIVTTPDKKVELVGFSDKTIACVPSVLRYNAFYPIYPVSMEKPVKAVLMDLDGTSVKSEEFWMYVIEQSMATLMNNPKFTLEDADAPFVAGHSVSEHLCYCIEKYCPDKKLADARKIYYEKVDFELKEIMQGRGHKDAFTPTEGLKDFLYLLKDKGIKIGLVTSGLYEKAMPEIISAFRTLDMGDPIDFYDAIITAGNAFKKGQTGNMSEFPIKPHPWVYSETGVYGLGIPFEERNSVVAIEDSGAGVCSARIAGYTTIGLASGNIVKGGTLDFCQHYENTLEDIAKIILD